MRCRRYLNLKQKSTGGKEIFADDVEEFVAILKLVSIYVVWSLFTLSPRRAYADQPVVVALIQAEVTPKTLVKELGVHDWLLLDSVRAFLLWLLYVKCFLCSLCPPLHSLFQGYTKQSQQAIKLLRTLALSQLRTFFRH